MTRTLSLFFAVATLTAAGCAKKAPVEELSVAPAPAAPAEVEQTLADAIVQMSANFKRVHFAFDGDTLDERSKSALAANVKLMQSHPSITVEVQGHADERGTVDYNLALGERRANAVKQYMTVSGVKSSRINTVSYGEEKPLSAGSGEVAWSENRRAEFRILTRQGTSVVGTTSD